MNFKETCFILVGKHEDNRWTCRKVKRHTGESARVEFDASWVLKREEARGDVQGFLHTHLAGFSNLSRRDLRTMTAWVSCLGKPLLCVVVSGEEIRGFVFTDDRGRPSKLESIALHGTNWIIGAACDERQVSS
jgi:proteasome lid subunit RPN8/RPN11